VVQKERNYKDIYYMITRIINYIKKNINLIIINSKYINSIYINSKYNNNIDLENNICLICYENILPSLKIENMNCYFKLCKCNVNIHPKCLEIWYNKNSTCPICRKFIFKNKNKNKNNTQKILIINKNINSFLKFLVIMLSLNYIFNFYLSIYKFYYKNNI